MLWDGGDADAAALLRRVHHVTLAPLVEPHVAAGRNASLSSEDAARGARFAAFRANHWQWGGKPGNYALMVKQGFSVNEAIRENRIAAAAAAAAAARDNTLPPPAQRRLLNLSEHWLFHLDVDEALLPGDGPGPRGALRVEDALTALPVGVTSARFLNAEAVPEHEGVRCRLAEVTLFKAHGRRVNGRVWRTFSDELKPHAHPEWPVFLLYGNGKPAARLSTPFLRQWGPHFFRGGDAPRLPARQQRRRALLDNGGGDVSLQEQPEQDDDASAYVAEADGAATGAEGDAPPRWLEVRTSRVPSALTHQ